MKPGATLIIKCLESLAEPETIGISWIWPCW